MSLERQDSKGLYPQPVRAVLERVSRFFHPWTRRQTSLPESDQIVTPGVTLSDLPVPEVTEPDLFVPKAVLYAIRRGKSLDTLTSNEEGKKQMLDSLAAIVLLDRNYRTIMVDWEEGKRKITSRKHVNRRWRKIQFAALDQIATLDGEDAIDTLWRIAANELYDNFLPGGPYHAYRAKAENLENRTKYLEAELISPKRLDHFHWLPWDPSWRGGTILAPLDDYGPSPNYSEIILNDKSTIRVRPVVDEQNMLRVKACELLGTVKHPSSIRALLQIGGRKSSFWHSWRDGILEDIAVAGLVKKGLPTSDAAPLLAILSSLYDEDERKRRIATEIAEQGFRNIQEVLTRNKIEQQQLSIGI